MPSPTRATKGVAPARATRLGWLALLALGIPLALAACGGGGNQRRGALDIEMLDNFYKRDVTRVPAGTRVRFSNGGRAVHNAVAANGGWSTPLSIQSGDAATVTLSKPGVYRFYCTFHGTSDGQGMAGTIVDGEVRRPNAISVTADGVAVENLTVRNAVANGLFWTGVTGYRASYVTASANGDYGIYAFGSRDGVFEQSYASGSPDAGFYIGQCNPCDAVIDGVVSEGNALGSHVEWSGFGNGIVLAGGNDSLVQRNRVLDHPNHGILVTPNLDEHFWTSAGNQVRDNVIAGSGRADLALAGPAGAGNCFSGNTVRSTVPVGLQAFQSCGGLRLPMRMDLSTTLQSLGLVAEANLDAFPHHRSQDAPPAPPQPQMAHRPGAPGRRHLRRPPRRPRPDRPGRGATIAWVGVVLVVPFLGVIAYHALGRPRIPGWLRATMIGGGIVAYVLILAIGALIGGIV